MQSNTGKVATMVARSPPPAPPSDAEVFDLEARRVRAALAGDGRAFADLVRPHLPMLLRVAARGCGSVLAEDVVQETLSIAHQQLDRYEPGTALRSWLASIAAQRAWTQVRSELRRKHREERVGEAEQPADPEQTMRAVQLAERVDAALARLPEKRRQAAILRMDAGLSYGEIAAAVGSTEGSARVLVHMAIKSLRAELGDLLPVKGGTK